MGVASLIAMEVNAGVRALPNWVPFAALGLVAAGALVWLSRAEVRVVEANDAVEIWAGPAHLPVEVVARSTAVPRSAKSAATKPTTRPAAAGLPEPQPEQLPLGR